ncbi:hypothetical protein [Nocardioides sp. T2.26MG-1]|uniref:hypothetical protein n=1 Tax=Nocardioides sp. T2.26MG-1 TaxID=3041166 RepID=UPI002477C2EA|nr:hypothetical protein [Nocardioides sp. T2.26MG-1]CAI9409651.1 hypothetical protein HIDPHFAB_01330 [Nocardioides sp. T2.26MG-1]
MDLTSPTATKVLGGLGLLVVAALGWTVAVGPETSTLAETRQSVADIRDQNAVLTTQLASLVKQQQQLPETRRTARRMAQKFPATADQPGLFEAVTTAAVDAGIGAQGVTTLTPTPPVIGAAGVAADGAAADGAAAGGAAADGAPAAGAAGAPAAGAQLARQTVTVAVTGSYDQTQVLLENLEHMPRAYLVTSVSVSGDPAAGVFTTSITGDMFVMSPVEDPDDAPAAGTTTGTAATTDPEG